MRTLMGFAAVGAVVLLLAGGAIVALAVELSPYVILGVVIGAVIRRRRRPAPSAVYRPVAPPRPQLTHGGWVYVPVWVQPPLTRPVQIVDAQFVRDRRDG